MSDTRMMIAHPFFTMDTVLSYPLFKVWMNTRYVKS
jgi:hypothetical protein